MSEESKKNILIKELDPDQLEQVTGGIERDIKDVRSCTNTSKRDDCQATVEYGSWCWSNDACYAFDCTYHGNDCDKEDIDSSL